MIKKIISGGQTGADQGGLIAAKRCGIQTGGWIPKGFLTRTGPNPKLGEEYGLQEHSSDKYPPRTFTNARDSDATIRLAINFNSSGELCTLKAINQYKKPYIDVDINNPIAVEEVVDWIQRNHIETLNVAGNCESRQSGICDFVADYLEKVIQQTNKF